jgi:2-keto-4-pentenoate hydratase
LDQKLEMLADRLFRARESGTPIPPIRSELSDGDVDAAYKIQFINMRRRIGAGATPVGRKIGLTSAAVQKQLGVDQPDFGMLFDTMGFRGDAVKVSRGKLIAPRLEAEIALILASDITTELRDTEALRPFIQSVAAAGEIVDSAVAGWDIQIVDTVADNASSGLFVIGTPQPFDKSVDLAARAMRLTMDGELKSSGTGAATMGSPLNALLWLANIANAFGDPLRKGDIILSGSLGPIIPFNPGEYEIEINGFATLRITCSA